MSDDNKSAPEWTTDLPDDLKSNPKINEFKSKADLAKSYLNLQSLVGNSVRVPDPSDAEATRKVLERLGTPKDPAEYEVDGDDPTSKSMRDAFHAAGLTKSQAKTLYGLDKAARSQAQKEYEATLETRRNELKSEWGDKFAANEEKANRALQAMKGTEIEQAYNLLEKSDPKIAKKLVVKIGEMKMENSTNKGGDGGGEPNLKEEYDKLMAEGTKDGLKSPFIAGRGKAEYDPSVKQWWEKFDRVTKAMAEKGA